VVLHGSGGAGSYWMDRFASTLMPSLPGLHNGLAWTPAKGIA
jgi:hypothetical protein